MGFLCSEDVARSHLKDQQDEKRQEKDRFAFRAEVSFRAVLLSITHDLQADDQDFGVWRKRQDTKSSRKQHPAQ